MKVHPEAGPLVPDSGSALLGLLRLLLRRFLEDYM